MRIGYSVAGMSQSQPVVLVVQSDADSQEMYTEFLRHHGFHPIAVSTAAEALSAAPTADVIVTGIQLPGDIDGLQMLAEVKRDQRTKHIPCIVLTAYANQRERAETAHCDGFLAKPSLPDELLREIRRVLARSSLGDVRGEAVKADLRADTDQAAINPPLPRRPRS